LRKLTQELTAAAVERALASREVTRRIGGASIRIGGGGEISR
jgi:hypothetical protein